MCLETLYPLYFKLFRLVEGCSSVGGVRACPAEALSESSGMELTACGSAELIS